MSRSDEVEDPTEPSFLREFAKAEPLEPPWIPQKGDTLDGQFVIHEKRGEGGLGIVYRARALGLDIDVAIKIMHVPGKEALFEQEARATAQVDHPNAIRIYDFGREKGTPYLVLEWLDGHTIGTLLQTANIPLDHVLRIMISVMDALAHVHGKNIIHGDISSSNVFITNDARVKVIDFGLTKYRIDQIPDTNLQTHPIENPGVAGTMGFVAPECFEGNTVTSKSDIWSAGALLFLLVAHRMPHQTSSWAKYASRIKKGPPPRVRQLDPDLPVALESLVARMLDVKPDVRPTAAEIVEQLRAILTDIEGHVSEAKRSAILCLLTPREKEIAEMLVNTSFSQKELASHLGLSEATIRTHIERIYRRLNVHSRSELVTLLRGR